MWGSQSRLVHSACTCNKALGESAHEPTCCRRGGAWGTRHAKKGVSKIGSPAPPRSQCPTKNRELCQGAKLWRCTSRHRSVPPSEEAGRAAAAVATTTTTTTMTATKVAVGAGQKRNRSPAVHESPFISVRVSHGGEQRHGRGDRYC